MFTAMIMTATELANGSKSVIDRVLSRHETGDVQRHGKAVVQIRRKVGINARELIERLKQANFTAEEARELKEAMDAANKIFSHADRH